MTGVKGLAITGVFAAGLGFANIWPLLFSITVEEKPECANELSRLDVHGHFRRRHRALNHGTAGQLEIGNICLRRAGRLFRLSAGSVA